MSGKEGNQLEQGGRSRTSSANSKADAGIARSSKVARSPNRTSKTGGNMKDKEKTEDPVVGLLKELNREVTEIKRENAAIKKSMDTANKEIKEEIAVNGRK